VQHKYCESKEKQIKSNQIKKIDLPRKRSKLIEIRKSKIKKTDPLPVGPCFEQIDSENTRPPCIFMSGMICLIVFKG
jgi:hypothetical protein